MSDDLRDWIFGRYIPQNLKIRDARTRSHYRRAVDDLAELLGREPTLADLSDETLTALIVHLLDSRKLAECTANERAGRIKAFWTWAARKRHVQEWPTFSFVAEPDKIPVAWREDELVKLFNACRVQRGDICGIPAWRWWFCLHGFLWCSGERIGAALAMRVDHLHLAERVAVLPASIRKGKRKPAVHRLWEDLVEMLKAILPPAGPVRDLVFPWPKNRTTLYYHHSKLLRWASLPQDRTAHFHRMRVSHASWLHVSGQDATQALGHSDPATTRRSYIDPSLARQDETKLFRPW